MYDTSQYNTIQYNTMQFEGTSIQIRSSLKSIMKIDSEFVCIYVAYFYFPFQKLQKYLIAFRWRF